MSEPYICPCGVKAKPGRWDNCSNCGNPLPQAFQRLANDRLIAAEKVDAQDTKASKARSPRSNSQERNVYESPKSNKPVLSDDARAIISEQRRTTAAIRSLAIFFFINLTSSVIGSAIIYLGVLFIAPPVIIVGSVVVVVGFIVAVISGFDELKRA